jgi:hypothetical protein
MMYTGGGFHGMGFRKTGRSARVHRIARRRGRHMLKGGGFGSSLLSGLRRVGAFGASALRFLAPIVPELVGAFREGSLERGAVALGGRIGSVAASRATAGSGPLQKFAAQMGQTAGQQAGAAAAQAVSQHFSGRGLSNLGRRKAGLMMGRR